MQAAVWFGDWYSQERIQKEQGEERSMGDYCHPSRMVKTGGLLVAGSHWR